MTEISGDGLFTKQLFKIDLTLTPSEFSKNLDEKFLESLKFRVEGKILLDKGYIENNSVEILKRTAGQIEDNTFTGNIVSRVIYQANVCNPAIGSVVSAKIQNVNNLGFLALNGPLYIIIPREIHKNLDLFGNYNRGDLIDIRIIKKEFNFKENRINVVGQLDEDYVVSNKKMITFKKKVNKKDSSKAEVSEITEMTEIDDIGKNVVEDTDVDVDEDEVEAKNVLEEDEESVEDQEDFGDKVIEDEDDEDNSDFELDDGDDFGFEEQENENFD